MFTSSFIVGVDGRDGEDVPQKKGVDELTQLGFKCGNATTVRKGPLYSVQHNFCGTPAIQGSDGGDGGCGGSGGRSGQIQLFLTNQSNIFTFQQNGMENLISSILFRFFFHFDEIACIHILPGARGTDGRGGMGGREAKNGRNYHIRILYVSHLKHI